MGPVPGVFDLEDAKGKPQRVPSSSPAIGHWLLVRNLDLLF